MVAGEESALEIVVHTLLSGIQSFFQITSVLLGGVFGIYLILLVLRWWQHKQLLNTLDYIKRELHELKELSAANKRRPRKVR